nr:unnamed protein product [Callosobruchus analis]
MDDEVIDLILDFSIKYAQDNNRHEFSLSKNELLNFIGILLFSGYHTLPHIQHYWSTEENKGIDLVKKCMSRNRFQSIKQNLHLSDNSILDKNDKFAKVRPFFDVINKKILQFGMLSFNLSIDEQIVPYFGRHSCKMFIKAGTIRENRTNKCPMENCKSFAKKKRGTYLSTYESESKVCIVRWQNNSVVTVASNVYNVDPVQNVKRYDRKEAKNINIPQPHAIAQYNKYMGGVDSHDNGVANYRWQVFGKKWWWPLFSNSLDSLVVNAWKLYNLFNEKNISQLDFKSYMALRLLKTDNSYSKKPCTCHR